MERQVNVIEDLNGKKTVFIHDILFKGKRAVNWDEVEKYLRQYVGEFYQIEACNKMIYIGSDIPDEYTHSNYNYFYIGISKGTFGKRIPSSGDSVFYIRGRETN